MKTEKYKKIPKSKRTFSWMNPKLEVRGTKKYGKGVFAKEDIRKDELLAVFGGYVMTIQEEEKLPSFMNDYGLQISRDFVLGIKKKAEVSDAEYFNHSCDPNAGFHGQIFLVAMRDVEKGEEITFDYAMVLCSSRGAKYYKFKCFCERTNCRKYLTEADWKNPELQKKYKGYFQYFLQDKINEKHYK